MGLEHALLSRVAPRTRVATRRSILVLSLVLGSLALVAGLLTAFTMWLQTAAARGWIERALAREVDPAAALDHVVAHPSARSRAQRDEIAVRSGTSERSAPSIPDEGEPGELSWRA